MLRSLRSDKSTSIRLCGPVNLIIDAINQIGLCVRMRMNGEKKNPP